MPSPRSPDKRKAAPQMEKEGSEAAGNRGQAEPAMAGYAPRLAVILRSTGIRRVCRTA